MQYNKNNPFTPMQYGFRQKSSCTYEIAEITDLRTDGIDEQSSRISCFVNLQKAFDSLDQTILVPKLSSYGFSDPLGSLDLPSRREPS